VWPLRHGVAICPAKCGYLPVQAWLNRRNIQLLPLLPAGYPSMPLSKKPFGMKKPFGIM